MSLFKQAVKAGFVASAVCSAALSLNVQAEQLNAAPGLPPAHPSHTPLYTEFARLLPENTEGRLTAKIFGPEVTSASNMRSALRNQIVDVGFFLPSYFPADLPNINLVADLAVLGDNALVMSSAMAEYVTTCDDCQDELRDLGIVYTGTISMDVYNLLSSTPVKSLDDLQGMRIRVGGPQFSRWVEAMGASPVSTSVNETYEALSQGVIDGTLTVLGDIPSFRLEDVVKYVTMIDLGTYHAGITHAVNMATWKDLNAQDREGLIRSSVTASALGSYRAGFEIPQEAKDLAAEHGIQFLEPEQDLILATQNFAEQDLDTAIDLAENRYSLENGHDKVDRFVELVDKWTSIVEELDNDPAAVAEAVWNQVWVDVDFRQYGD